MGVFAGTVSKSSDMKEAEGAWDITKRSKSGFPFKDKAPNGMCPIAS